VTRHVADQTTGRPSRNPLENKETSDNEQAFIGHARRDQWPEHQAEPRMLDKSVGLNL